MSSTSEFASNSSARLRESVVLNNSNLRRSDPTTQIKAERRRKFDYSPLETGCTSLRFESRQRITLSQREITGSARSGALRSGCEAAACQTAK